MCPDASSNRLLPLALKPCSPCISRLLCHAVWVCVCMFALVLLPASGGRGLQLMVIIPVLQTADGSEAPASQAATLPTPLFSALDAPSNGQVEGSSASLPCTRLQPFPKVHRAATASLREVH